MPRSLPWSNHLTATGERPLFFAEVELSHQTWSLGLYDLVPGSIQGRLRRLDDLVYQLRGGNDRVGLYIDNSKFSALGKAARCRGKSNAAWSAFSGNSVYLLPTSGHPFNISGDHAFMGLFRVWTLSGDNKDERYLAVRGGHFRLIIQGDGTLVLQVKNGASWPTVYTDSQAVRLGELFAVGFSYDQSTGVVRYMRRSDSGDLFIDGAATINSSPATTRPVIINGGGGGLISGGVPWTQYLEWLDVDELRWWTRTLSDAEFKAIARRTLKPAEANDANLSAWARLDEGAGSSFAVISNTGDVLTGGMSADNAAGLFSTLSTPDWISGLTRDRFTDHLEGGKPLEQSTIRIKVTFGDPVTNTPVTLFVGRVFQVRSADEMEVDLELVDVSFYADKLIGMLVNDTDFPRAPAGSIGKMIPSVFGAVEDVPGVHTESAFKTRLAASVLAADTTITVASTADFPSSGSIRIDDETIGYTGKTATQFTGCTRGAVSTVATSHVTGTLVAEVANEQWLFHDGPATISNIRKVNSKGEEYPVDPLEVVLVFSTAMASGVTLVLPPAVVVRGEGSNWASIDNEGPSAFDNSLDAGKAAALHSDWREDNWATINAVNSKLSVERTTNFDGPVLVSGVLKSYLVIEHHRVATLSAGKRVEVRLEIGGVPVLILGDLQVQSDTPDRALQQGRYDTFSAGFEASHQHDIPGSLHSHDIGTESSSVIFRPQGSDYGWAQGLGGSGYPGGGILFSPLGPPFGAAGPFYTARSFYQPHGLDGATDDDPDTFHKFPSTYGGALGFRRLTFAGLTRTNRQVMKARVVAICSGNGVQRELNFVLKGDQRVTTGPLVSYGSGMTNRTTVTSPYVDLSTANVIVADLLRPDSYVEIRQQAGATGDLEVWEVYLECELGTDAESSRVARPRYDDWPKALDQLRDGTINSFEPHVYPCIPAGVEYSGGVPVAWRSYEINPNEPVFGPDLPFNNQVAPTLKFYFTDLDEPAARLKDLVIYIAHNNCHDEGPHEFAVPTNVARHATPPAPIVGSAPAVWNPNLSADFVGPRFLVKVYIKGQHIPELDFSLDMTDAAERVYYDPAVAPSGKRLGAWSFPSVMWPWGGAQPSFPISSRVESSSGWQNLLGKATGGGDFTINDLIDPTSYIEITLPNPSLSTWVDQISSEHTNPGSDPGFATQFSPYSFEVPAHGPKMFDVRIEYVSDEIELQAADQDVGNTSGLDALSRSSLTWFDTTAVFLLAGSWTALTGIEMVCEAIGFGASDAVRILRAHGMVEFGVVGTETTDKLIADVDAGDGGNPIDHVERIFDDVIGSSFKDTTAFTAAKALARTDAAGVLLEQRSAMDVVRSILRQYSFSGHWEAGVFVPLYKPALSSLGAPSTTLDKNDIVRRSVSMRRLSIEDVVNEVEVLFGKRLYRVPGQDDGGWSGQTLRESTTSKAAYGLTRRVVEECDWIWTLAAAQEFGDRYLDYFDHVAAVVNLATFLNGLGHIRGDVLGLDHALVSSSALEVLGLRITPGGAGRAPSIQFELIDRANRPT